MNPQICSGFRAAFGHQPQWLFLIPPIEIPSALEEDASSALPQPEIVPRGFSSLKGAVTPGAPIPGSYNDSEGCLHNGPVNAIPCNALRVVRAYHLQMSASSAWSLLALYGHRIRIQSSLVR
jgi:hypothetical protein